MTLIKQTIFLLEQTLNILLVTSPFMGILLAYYMHAVSLFYNKI